MFAMGESAERFGSLRPSVLARLVEVRGAIDPIYAAMPDDGFRDRIDAFLSKIEAYLSDGDWPRFARFVRRWMSLPLGEGQSAESVLHSVVAIGDVIVQHVRQNEPANRATVTFIGELNRLTLATVRVMVETLADELSRRQAKQGEGAT